VIGLKCFAASPHFESAESVESVPIPPRPPTRFAARAKTPAADLVYSRL
jgi:hypothetical protein